MPTGGRAPGHKAGSAGRDSLRDVPALLLEGAGAKATAEPTRREEMAAESFMVVYFPVASCEIFREK